MNVYDSECNSRIDLKVSHAYIRVNTYVSNTYVSIHTCQPYALCIRHSYIACIMSG